MNTGKNDRQLPSPAASLQRQEVTASQKISLLLRCVKSGDEKQRHPKAIISLEAFGMSQQDS